MNLGEMAVGVADAHFSRLPCCAHTPLEACAYGRILGTLGCLEDAAHAFSMAC